MCTHLVIWKTATLWNILASPLLQGAIWVSVSKGAIPMHIMNLQKAREEKEKENGMSLSPVSAGNEILYGSKQIIFWFLILRWFFSHGFFSCPLLSGLQMITVLPIIGALSCPEKFKSIGVNLFINYGLLRFKILWP